MVRALLKLAFFVESTIIEANADMPVVAEENFCPIYTYFKDIDEVIKLNNSVRYGLSSSIFIDNLQNAEKFLSSLGSDCGIANVNIGT